MTAWKADEILNQIQQDFLDARVIQKNYDLGLLGGATEALAQELRAAVLQWPGKWEAYVCRGWRMGVPVRVWLSVVNSARRDYVPPRWGSKEWKEQKKSSRLRWHARP